MKNEIFGFWGYLFLSCNCFFLKISLAAKNANLKDIELCPISFQVGYKGKYMSELPSFKENIQFRWYFNLIVGPRLFTQKQVVNEAEKQATFLSKCKFWMSYFYRQRTLYVFRVACAKGHIIYMYMQSLIG